MIIRGDGQYLYDELGECYLDTRNNVCHVGHCHPRVVRAVCDQVLVDRSDARQAHRLQRRIVQVAVLNTNLRYLHPNVCALATKLLEKCPAPLDERALDGTDRRRAGIWEVPPMYLLRFASDSTSFDMPCSRCAVLGIPFSLSTRGRRQTIWPFG